MLQRKQTLFLLGSVLISILLLYVPVFVLLPAVNDAANTATSKSFTITINPLLMILNGSVGVLSFFTILLYKRRNIQIRMCKLAMLLTTILIFLLFFFADSLSSGTDQRIQYSYGSYLPLIELLLIFLAMRFIKHDEDLVRSADRLR